MPYINAEEYKMVKHILVPEVPQSARATEVERAIYDLNHRIRNLPGTGPSEDWRYLLEQHDRLVAAYRRAGGRKSL